MPKKNREGDGGSDEVAPVDVGETPEGDGLDPDKDGEGRPYSGTSDPDNKGEGRPYSGTSEPDNQGEGRPYSGT